MLNRLSCLNDLSLSIKDAIRLAVVLVCLFAACLNMHADEQKTFLIINSYSENAPWSQAIMKPINQKLNTIPEAHVEMVNINSAEITDSAGYYRIEDRIFEAYANRHPSYVILVGNFAFMLRDRIKAEWGDRVPMLLFTRINKYAPLYYYFAGYQGPYDWETLDNIADIRGNYNLTVIETPDFVNENIDLMTRMIPNMKKLVFISDRVFTNRSIDRRIRKYLKKKYPELGYEWLQESDSTHSQFQDYMLNYYPNTGFLISTWDNSRNDDNLLSITGGNLHMISSAANPIFALRSSYLSLGAFGGIYSDDKATSKAISYVLEKMLAGVNMRTLPLFMCDQGVPSINHQRMLAMGYSEEDFPEDTDFIFRAPTLWEAHSTEIIGGALIILIIVISVILYISAQRRRIITLQTLALFIKQMPWAYSKARILYNRDCEIFDISYDQENMNSAFLKLLTENQLPNMEWKMFPLRFIADKTNQLIETGNPVSFSYHFEKTDTYYEFLLCRINPTKLKDGEKPKYIDIFANNITKRIKAQQKLRTTMRTLDITLNVARIIPWQWNIKRGAIYYDGFRALTNLRPSDEYEPITQRYSISEDEYIEIVDKEDRERIEKIMAGFRDGKIIHKRTEFRVSFKRKGQVRHDWIEINAATTEYSSDCKPKTVLGSLLVITERKRQEQALIEAKEKASESDRMKSAFLANMSHEIRTPLNAIVGFSSLITQTDDREQKAKYSGIIAHNNDLLLHLINDVLDLAKIESNTLELQVTDTDLNDLMRQIYDTVRLRIADGVVFNMVLGAEICHLKADPNRLMQVLINLLTNAAKFTQKGSITYGYEINDDEIEFFVRDTGIGISKENQDKLFKRFSKLNNFVQGTGLGLSICKSFIEKMGGQIWVKSRGEGKGTSFFFTLPYIKTDKVASLAITENAVVEARLPQKDSREITILVAEDNPSNYLLFESILNKHYKLLHANNGREAVEMFKRYEPQLILMDIRMPEMDGYEATIAIRKISQSVPIIAVTAHAFVTEKDKIMKSGFNAYVAKPINQKELMNSVKTQLNKRFFVF